LFPHDAEEEGREDDEIADERGAHGAAGQGPEKDEPGHGARHGGQESACDDGGRDEEGETDAFEGVDDRIVHVAALLAFPEKADEEMNGVVHRDSEADAEGKDAGNLEGLVEEGKDTGVEEEGEGVGDNADETEGEGA